MFEYVLDKQVNIKPLIIQAKVEPCSQNKEMFHKCQVETKPCPKQLFDIFMLLYIFVDC